MFKILSHITLPLTLCSALIFSATVANAQVFGGNTSWREARDASIARAIDGSDYECGPTEFDQWIAGGIAAIEDFDRFLNLYYGLFVGDWAADYSLLFDNNASDDYIGLNGEYTRELLKRHKDNQRFWDVPTQDVQLQGMHGAVLADDDKMVPLVELYLAFGLIPPIGTAQQIVDYAQFVIETDAGLGYDNPAWTLNAFAFSAEGEEILPGFGVLPDKIVMGDGLLEFFSAVGLGENAPDMVHAHEFAHHVQFEIGAFTDHEGTPEATRRTELMADGFAAYYCAHARGATFQAKRIVDVLSASYLIGDCGFESTGHHGTPNQREASAAWGAKLAKSAKKRGHIKSATTLLDLFDAELPNLVAPDAP